MFVGACSGSHSTAIASSAAGAAAGAFFQNATFLVLDWTFQKRLDTHMMAN
ncbi:hypothetical protein SSCG_06164, partial [Streptomyces clavuligerus]